ncbi:MAG: hypothetical protein IKZ82_02815 [Clostridia bacterium]|nr:hypothetical protein [Clostridia bacterium]
MIKRGFKIILTLALASATALAAAFVVFPEKGYKKSDKDNSRLGLLELHGAFRNSSAVIEGVCEDCYLSPTGSYYSNYTVEKVIAGSSSQKGKMITVLGSDEKGNRRIIYLGNEINDVHSENESIYTVYSGGLLSFDGERISLSNGRSLPIELFENDIVSLKTETTVPLKYYYYNTIEKTVKNSYSIFIGRVERAERRENAELLTNSRGEFIKQQGAYTELSVSVMNGLVWQHNFGDKVKIRIVDGDENYILDERTNEHFIPEKTAFEPTVGNVYIFFVNRSPDAKAEHYFLINAYQGMIETFGESVFVHPENSAFSDITTLKELINALLKASGMPVGY